MFRTRLFTAVLGIPVIAGVMYAGGIYWQAFFGLLGLVGMHEIFAMMAKNDYHPVHIMGYLLFLILVYSGQYPDYLPLILFICMLLFVVYAVITYPRTRITDIALSAAAAIYLGWTLHYAQAVSAFPHAFRAILLALLLTWASDVGGYLCGRCWGKHKLAALLSPKKTWEGAIGAVILPVGVTITAFYYYPEFSLFNYIGLGLTAGVIAQFGDLFMSSIKRFFQVKDSGNILPGHGGVLDRFDSFLLVVPVVYYFFTNIL
jgi:phosphatidate cytidylyltransferase